MNSNKSAVIAQDKKPFRKIYKISLTLFLITLAIIISPAQSYFGLIKPVSAATLGFVRVVPMSNLATMQTTYDIFFTTATTGAISTIEIDFGSNFNIASATRVIENSGIGGSSSLTVAGSIWTYKVFSPVTIPAGTIIRLEISRIVANLPGNFVVTITTKDSNGGIIDGPTQSTSFQIFAVGPNAVSTGFMIRKTLVDDIIGNAQGWNPNGVNAISFFIDDSDISGSVDTLLVDIFLDGGNNKCEVGAIIPLHNQFIINCETPPANGAKLQYSITKLPAHVIGGIITSSSESSSQYESLRAHDQITSEFP